MSFNVWPLPLTLSSSLRQEWHSSAQWLGHFWAPSLYVIAFTPILRKLHTENINWIELGQSVVRQYVDESSYSITRSVSWAVCSANRSRRTLKSRCQSATQEAPSPLLTFLLCLPPSSGRVQHAPIGYTSRQYGEQRNIECVVCKCASSKLHPSLHQTRASYGIFQVYTFMYFYHTLH